MHKMQVLHFSSETAKTKKWLFRFFSQKCKIYT